MEVAWDDVIESDVALDFIEDNEPWIWAKWYHNKTIPWPDGEDFLEISSIKINASSWAGFMCHVSPKLYPCNYSPRAQRGTEHKGEYVYIRYNLSKWGLAEDLRCMTNSAYRDNFSEMRIWFVFECVTEGFGVDFPHSH